MFLPQDEARHTKIWVVSSVVVRCMTVEYTKLPLQVQKLNYVRQSPLYKSWTDSDLTHCVPCVVSTIPFSTVKQVKFTAVVLSECTQACLDTCTWHKQWHWKKCSKANYSTPSLTQTCLVVIFEGSHPVVYGQLFIVLVPSLHNI